MRYHTIRLIVISIGICLFFLSLSGCAGTPTPEPSEPAAAEPVLTAEEEDVWSLFDRGETGKAREYFLGKVDVKARDTRGRTPLHAAAELQDPELAAFFISLGAEVDAGDELGRTPLGISAEKLDGATGRILAAAGADIHRALPDGGTIALAAIKGGNEFLEAILIPATLEAEDGQGRTILHLAAAEGNVPAVELILGMNPSTNKRDRNGKTPLDLAFNRTDLKSYAETADHLIRAGEYSENPLFPYFAPAVRSSNFDIRSADGIAPLHYTTGAGYTGYVQYLLDKGANVNIKNASGATPLHEAARAGNVQVMELLLAAGANVNAQDAKGNTAMHIAIPANAQRAVISLLLSYGANPNLRDEHGDSPLHITITLNRNVDILRALLEGKADVSIHNIEGKTPLYLAVQENRIAHIPLLLQYKSDIFAVNNAGVTPFTLALQTHSPVLPALITEETVLQSDSGGNTALMITVMNNGDPKIAGLILDKNALVNARNKEGDTSLHLAVQRNNQEIGELLIARGADIFAPNAKGESPLYLSFQGNVREWMLNSLTLEARDGLGNSVLHYAAQWRLDAYIPLIVQKGARTEAANATGETPLFVAVKIDSPSTVLALVSAGASITGRDTLGNSGLHAAVRWNAPRAAEALVSAGADINAHALNGKTPLHDAVRLGIVDVEQVLTHSGANLEVRDNEGNTPFMEAVTAGHPRVVERLADLGSDPMVRNSRGDTPLHIAVAMERSDLTTLLLGWGASIHARNSRGRTPFQIALQTSPRMVSTLLTKDRIAISDDEGHSPLHIAIAANASVNIVRTILDQGARIAAVDAEGRTPLRLAVDLNNWETAKLLADAGSDPFSTTNDGKSPAGIVLTKGPEPVKAIFSGRGISARDPSGNTILHYAAQSGSPELISLLMDLGANKATRNIAAESPGDIAQRWNRRDLLALLN
jgi:ankyrin repeat protein